MIERQRFERWLRSKKPAEVVGCTDNAESCPVASFMQGLGYEGVFVSCMEVHWKDDAITHRDNLPTWAKTFVRRVDQTGEDNVTAEAAIAIMENIDQ